MNIFGGKLFQPTGWICPKCGRVWSPSTFSCWNCNQQTVVMASENYPKEIVHTLQMPKPEIDPETDPEWRRIRQDFLHSWDG